MKRSLDDPLDEVTIPAAKRALIDLDGYLTSSVDSRTFLHSASKSDIANDDISTALGDADVKESVPKDPALSVCAMTGRIVDSSLNSANPVDAVSSPEPAQVDSGYPYSFPVEPYSTQIQLMRGLSRLLEHQLVGIVESPTGTGKTLSTLCAALSFIERRTNVIRQKVADYEKIAKALEAGNDNDDFDTSLANFKKAKEYRDYMNYEKDNFDGVDRRLEIANNRIEVHKNVNKVVDIEDCDVGVSTSEAGEPVFFKIVYATRTHSQIEQLTSELKRTRFKPRVVILGSRTHLCSNPSVNSLPSSAGRERCRDLRDKNKCPYYKVEKVNLLSDHILAGITHDLKDMMKEAGCLQACSYFASREAARFCEVVFVPYATLLDAEMRRSSGLVINHKTIVIVDEAHNLFSATTEMNSCGVTLPELELSLKIVTFFKEAKSDKLSSVNFKNLTMFEMVLTEMVKKLTTHKSDAQPIFGIDEFRTKVFEATMFVKGATIAESLKKEHLLPMMQKYYFSNKFGSLAKTDAPSGVKGFLKKLKTKVPDESPDSKQPEAKESFPLYQVTQFLIAVCEAKDNFKVIVHVSEDLRRYQLLCLNGGKTFKSVARRALATILIGGTMNPPRLLRHLLTKDCQVKEERIQEMSFDHILDANNLRIVSVEEDSIGKLKFTHANLNEGKYARLLSSLRPFVDRVKNGLVVFFPSKTFMRNFLACVHGKLKTHPDWQALSRRNLFHENASPDVLAKYSDVARKHKATLFAVLGGKFSEGVNFSDELARCVVIVGLPYPNTENVEFKAKVSYLAQHFQDPSLPSQLPADICMTSVNQAIGRVVRHRADYGCVILLDQRYSLPTHSQRISAWARKFCLQASTSKDALAKLKDFRGIE